MHSAISSERRRRYLKPSNRHRLSEDLLERLVDGTCEALLVPVKLLSAEIATLDAVAAGQGVDLRVNGGFESGVAGAAEAGTPKVVSLGVDAALPEKPARPLLHALV